MCIYLFMYLLVQRHAIHSSSTLRCDSINKCGVLYYLQSPLAFSALHYLLVSNPLPPDSVTQQLWSPQNYAPTEDADHHPAHSDSCWFSQTTGTPGMLYWLHQVWLLVVASAVIQNTIRLLVLTKLLSFLTTVNHQLSITHSTSNWTSSATDALRTEQLSMSCCMHWDFFTCTVQQTETTMW